MTPIRTAVLLLALVGVIGPFVVARYVLDKFFPISVSGTPVPLTYAFAAYGVSFLLALACLALAARFLLRDKEPSDVEQGLENPEDLTY